MEILAARLKWLRENKRIPQKEIALEIGVSLNGYQKFESNDTNPKIDTLIKLAKFFNVSADFLLGLSNQISDNDDGAKIKSEIIAIKTRIKERQQSITREKLELDYAKKEQLQILELSQKYESGSVDYEIAVQRNEHLNRYIKNKKSQIVFLQHEIDEFELNYRNKIRDYFKYIAEIPYPDVVSDEVIKDMLPVEIKVNTLFDNNYVEVFGSNGLNFTYSNSKNSKEEAEEERMKLIEIFYMGKSDQ